MYPRFVIEAIVCLPKDYSARLLNFLHEWRVGADNPWFLTAANLVGSCRLFVLLLLVKSVQSLQSTGCHIWSETWVGWTLILSPILAWAGPKGNLLALGRHTKPRSLSLRPDVTRCINRI